MKSIVCWMWDPPETALDPGTVMARDSHGKKFVRILPASDYQHENIDLRRARERQARLRLRYPTRKFPDIPEPVKPPSAGKPPKPRRQFTAEHVNILQRMCARHMSETFRFVVISDENPQCDPAVEWFPTPPEARALADLQSPEGDRFPSCYRRLWAFSDGARALGDRLLCIDIDAVIVDSLMPLFDRPEDFVGWRPARDWGAKLRFGGGTYLLTPGTRTHVWTQFAGLPSIQAAREAGFRGSDQAWMSYLLAGKEAYWPQDCGIYSVRDLGVGLDRPPGAKLIHFNGHHKPHHYCNGTVAPVQWVLDNWK